MNKTAYQDLPRVKVSFQDQFCGCADEITSTVRYVFDQLLKIGVKPHFGLKLLLWEDDSDDDAKSYICQIGEVSKLGILKKRKFYAQKLNPNEFVRLDNKLAMIKINRKDYFYVTDLK